MGPSESTGPRERLISLLLYPYAEGLNLGADAEQTAINSACQQIEDALYALESETAQTEIAELELA